MNLKCLHRRLFSLLTFALLLMLALASTTPASAANGNLQLIIRTSGAPIASISVSGLNQHGQQRTWTCSSPNCTVPETRITNWWWQTGSTITLRIGYMDGQVHQATFRAGQLPRDKNADWHTYTAPWYAGRIGAPNISVPRVVDRDFVVNVTATMANYTMRSDFFVQAWGCGRSVNSGWQRSTSVRMAFPVDCASVIVDAKVGDTVSQSGPSRQTTVTVRRDIGLPSITTPAALAIITSGQVTIEFTPGALNYTNQFDAICRIRRASDGVEVYNSFAATLRWQRQTTFITPTLPSGQYRVSCIQGDTYNRSSAWTNDVAFEVMTSINPPQIVGPSAGDLIGRIANLNITLPAPADRSNWGVEVQHSGDTSFASATTVRSSGSTANTANINLELNNYNQPRYVRVRWSTRGLTSQWSTPLTLTPRFRYDREAAVGAYNSSDYVDGMACTTLVAYALAAGGVSLPSPASTYIGNHQLIGPGGFLRADPTLFTITDLVRINNQHQAPELDLQPGDIVFFGFAQADSEGYGHSAIVKSRDNNGNLQLLHWSLGGRKWETTNLYWTNGVNQFTHVRGVRVNGWTPAAATSAGPTAGAPAAAPTYVPPGR